MSMGILTNSRAVPAIHGLVLIVIESGIRIKDLIVFIFVLFGLLVETTFVHKGTAVTDEGIGNRPQGTADRATHINASLLGNFFRESSQDNKTTKEPNITSSKVRYEASKAVNLSVGFLAR